MNNECESDHKHYTCECGKSFDRLNQMTGHQAKCKVHKAILETELESRRLPNGLFKCENPDCNNEHDGSYASGRFCSKHCYKHTIALKSAEHRRLHPVKRRYSRSNYGKWMCKCCNEIFETRHMLQEHHKIFPEHVMYGKSTKGKTKITCQSVAKQASKLKQRYANGELIPWFKGKHHSIASRKKISESMKKAHSEGRANNFAKSRHSCGVKMSYPEKWFLGVINNEFADKNFVREYPFFKYSLDFAWPDKKRVIEIDGSQHYDGRFPERIKHDIERDIYLKSQGWKVLRLRWKYVYKQKKYWIKIAKRFIDNC